MNTLVLVADDDPFNLRLLQELCEAAGHRVMAAADGGEVLDVIARERPDLILLDVSMPVLDGFEVMRVLKADADLASIPVIVVTAAGDVDSRGQAIELGADDYVTKPFRVFEIQQRIRNALRVKAAEDEAARAREHVSGTSDPVDPLTRAGTSQQLVISLDYEFTRAERYHHELTCMVVRLQNYGDIVRSSGQEAGDGALVQLASGLRTCIRGIDHLFRSDLEEFTMLLPETGPSGADVVRERVEERAGDRSLWGAAIQPAPKLRIGQATFPSSQASDGDSLRLAALEASRRDSVDPVH